MTSYLTKNTNQERNLAAPLDEEDMALSRENEEGNQMNETPNENMPEVHTPSEDHTVVKKLLVVRATETIVSSAYLANGVG
jgi:hypothetical protein